MNLPAARFARPAGFCLVLTAWAALVAQVCGQSAVNRKHTETSLGPFPTEVRDSAVISPDGRHLAFIEPGATGEAVVLDGKRGEEFDRVAALEFASRQERLAYAAQRKDQWWIVAGQQRWGPYQRVGPPRFGPQGKRLALVVMLSDGKRAVMLDGQAGKPYDVISAGLIEFSPNGRRVAYGGVRDGKCFLVVDGRELGPYDDLGTRTGYRFSADGARLAFVAAEGDQVAVVVDEQKLPACHDVADLAFSPDGTRVAYAATDQQGGPWYVVVDGKKQPPHATLGDGTLRFGPGGRRLAYAAADAAGKWCVVVDGQAGPKFDQIGQMQFGPRGERFAYVVRRGDRQAVVLDGQEPRWFDRVGGGSLVFSPDGHHFGYIARNDWARFVVIDGARKHRYTMVGYLNFSPDSRHHAYVAIEDGKTFTVVDDLPAAHRYDAVWLPPERKLLFDYRDRFHYLAVRDGEALLVDEKIE